MSAHLGTLPLLPACRELLAEVSIIRNADLSSSISRSLDEAFAHKDSLSALDIHFSIVEASLSATQTLSPSQKHSIYNLLNTITEDTCREYAQGYQACITLAERLPEEDRNGLLKFDTIYNKYICHRTWEALYCG